MRSNFMQLDTAEKTLLDHLEELKAQWLQQLQG